MRNYAIVIGALVLAVVVAFWAINVRVAKAPGPVACTTEAKLCPDGSAVGRTGPNCEFAACPAANATSTLAVGESATINGTTVKVLSLVGDSRCPADVQCIQAGTVRVLISVNTSSSEFTLTLGQPQVVGDATITLSAVIPAQKYAKQTLQPSDYRFTFTVVPKVGPVACTMEAKLCPDGSYVGRTGPNCEFTPCPTVYNSGVRGTVMLGPTCPVMRDPPDPQCADKPYATAITVYKTGSNAPFIIGNSDATGAFQFSLPPGSYTLVASGGTTLPRCSDTSVAVVPNEYTTTTISCDTGIR